MGIYNMCCCGCGLWVFTARPRTKRGWISSKVRFVAHHIMQNLSGDVYKALYAVAVLNRQRLGVNGGGFVAFGRVKFLGASSGQK